MAGGARLNKSTQIKDGIITGAKIAAGGLQSIVKLIQGVASAVNAGVSNAYGTPVAVTFTQHISGALIVPTAASLTAGTIAMGETITVKITLNHVDSGDDYDTTIPLTHANDGVGYEFTMDDMYNISDYNVIGYTVAAKSDQGSTSYVTQLAVNALQIG